MSEWYTCPKCGATRETMCACENETCEDHASRLPENTPKPPFPESPDFVTELEHLINKHSMESGSDTPDFILARLLTDVLFAFNAAVMKREGWYGDSSTPQKSSETKSDPVAFKKILLDDPPK